MYRSISVTFGSALIGLFAVAQAANADPPNPQDADPHSQNIHDMGHDLAPAEFFGVPDGQREIHSDIAFRGKLAFQGNYAGFRIIDISAPGNPRLISFQDCNGDQGDLVVWENILVRSWNSPKSEDRLCDGEVVPAGWEGLHVFDISDLNDPVLIAAVETECGSHTATAVPDLANNRLIIYNNVSGSPCDWIDIVEVPLDDPASTSVIGLVPLFGLSSLRGCHDMTVILGDANLAVCAGGNAANVYDIGENAFPGGSLEDPEFLYFIEETDDEGNMVGVGGGWHSGAFTWDGEVIVLGWEPGGGGQARCQASNPDIDKSLFFYEAATGAKLGQWVLTRPQSDIENCTIHNFNIVPLRSGRYVAVQGGYQSGSNVVDFTDPTDAFEVGWSDPAPLTPPPGFSLQIGGAWSSYWYNGFIYESDISEGLNVFGLSDKARAGAMRLDHLNPQTQEFTIAPAGE